MKTIEYEVSSGGVSGVSVWMKCPYCEERRSSWCASSYEDTIASFANMHFTCYLAYLEESKGG